MQAFPHHYNVTASGAPQGDVTLSGDKLENIRSAPPAEFGGPGNRWSPESLLVAAVGDCFILTFRAMATASKLAWTSLECDITGTLDRVEGTMKFTRFEIRAKLDVAADADEARALKLMEKAEKGCLITNSLSAEIHLDAAVSRAS